MDLTELAKAHGITFDENGEMKDQDLEQVSAGKSDRSVRQNVNIRGGGRRRGR